MYKYANYKFAPTGKTTKQILKDSKEQYFYFKQSGYTHSGSGNYRASTKEIIKTYY